MKGHHKGGLFLGKGGVSDTTLERFDFSKERLDTVKDFYCGSNPWETEVADWIKSPDGALDTMNARGASVWLYASKKDGFVGYSSLATTDWNYPTKKDPKVSHRHVLYMGIRYELRREPLGARREDRYAYQIMRDLAAEVLKDARYPNMMSLYVHPDNVRAIRFYENYGFEHLPHKVWKGHIAMVVKL